MTAAPGYEIVHVQLAQQPARPAPAGPGRGSYLVFWWQDLALGHLFLTPGPPLSDEAYYAALLAAIAPAVDQYAAQKPAFRSQWRGWLGQDDLASWRAGMADAGAPWVPAAPPRPVAVSVIICTRGRPGLLRRCLHMLHGLAWAPAEIVVVDNAPTDESTREVARDFGEVVYVREPRAGLDIARNTGIRAAAHPVVAFVDDDVVVHPLLIYRIGEAFADETTAALTGLVLALRLDTEAQLIFEQHWSFNRGYVDQAYAPAYVREASNGIAPVWEIGAGANMAFRKAVFEQVGYFDELLDVGAAGCSGDSEMWYRILAHGYTIRYNPRAVVYHEHRQDMAGLRRQLFYYMRGHAAAALVQQRQYPRAGYARHVYRELPTYYARLIRGGFPFFRARSQTLWAELRGLASGIAFYYRTRK